MANQKRTNGGQMKRISILLVGVIIALVAVVFTQQAQNTTQDKMPIRSIPDLEAERLSRNTFSRAGV